MSNITSFTAQEASVTETFNSLKQKYENITNSAGRGPVRTGTHRYAVPPLLVCTLWRTRTPHELPVPFPVPSMSECLWAIHGIRLQHGALASLLSHGTHDVYFFVLAEVERLINAASAR